MTELLTSPTFVALIQAAGVGLLVVLAAVSQRFGHRKETSAPTSKDVVVQGLTVADTQAITEWAKTLQHTNQLIKERAEFERKMLAEAEYTNTLLIDLTHVIQRRQRQEAGD
jgi:hypothetical protein